MTVECGRNSCCCDDIDTSYCSWRVMANVLFI